MTRSSVELVFILHKGFKGLFRALLSIPLHSSHRTLSLSSSLKLDLVIIRRSLVTLRVPYFKLVLKLKIGLSNNQEVVGHVEGTVF